MTPMAEGAPRGRASRLIAWALAGFDPLLTSLCDEHGADAGVVFEAGGNGRLEAAGAAGLDAPDLKRLSASSPARDGLACWVRATAPGRARRAGGGLMMDAPGFAKRGGHAGGDGFDALACAFERVSGRVLLALFRPADTPFSLNDLERFEVWRRDARADVEAAIEARQRLAAQMRAAFVLTPRETAVLRLLLGGLDRRDIAARLQISENTYKFHQRAVFGKLGVARAAEVFATVLAAVDVAGALDPIFSLTGGEAGGTG